MHIRFSDIVLDDSQLSMRAKGIFATVGYLGSGCDFSKLLQHSLDDVVVLQAALEELVRAGYVSIESNTRIVIKPAATFGTPVAEDQQFDINIL